MRTRHTRKLLSSTLTLIVLGCAWFWLAPVGLGGSTSYVVTHGVSMEPRLHTGDLAIVRSQSSYHVGEIVAYDNKMLHTIVLHRIIGRAGARYIFKGDNNNFVDFEHPAASQLIGALWLHVARAGVPLQSIGSPALVGALVAVGLLLITGSVFARRRRLRRRERRADGGTQPPSRRPPLDPTTSAAAVLAVGLLALLPFLVLALVAFTRSPSAPRPYAVSYTQGGKLSYTAVVAPGPTYPTGRVLTGDPLFTHVVNAVNFRFAYGLDAVGVRSVTGMISLDASVVSTDGWKTTIQLVHPTRFRGSRAQIAGTLGLTSLLALIRSVQDTTKASGSYTLTLLPHVSVNGSVHSLPLQATFAPAVLFSLTELEAQPVISGGSPTVSSPAAAQSASSPFAPSASGTATGKHSQPVLLSLGIARISVVTARTLALGAIAVLVCTMLAMVAFMRPILALLRPPRTDRSADILARYGRQIVPIAHLRQLPGVPVIDVADMQALVQIAEHYDRSILHEATDEGDAFWVTDESGHFRFALGAPSATPQGAAVAPTTLDGLTGNGFSRVLEPDGAISAFQAQPAAARPPVVAFEASAPADATATATAGDTAAGEGWAVHAVPVAVMPEAKDWDSVHADADPDRMHARAAFARMTGLEWAPRS